MKKRKGKETGALSVWKAKSGKVKGIRKSTEHALVKGALANVAALEKLEHDSGDAAAKGRKSALSMLNAELHLLVPGVRAIPDLLQQVPQVAKKAPPSAKRLLSQRDAAKALGIGRPALTTLITTKQVNTTRVNGVAKVPVVEVERLAISGWDVDAPMPTKKSATKLSVISSSAKTSVKDEILKLKL